MARFADPVRFGSVGELGRRDHRRAKMLGKLHAESRDAAGATLDQNSLTRFELREEAIERMRRALEQFSIAGVGTTLPFLSGRRKVMKVGFRSK
jgi:biotin carboxylase